MIAQSLLVVVLLLCHGNLVLPSFCVNSAHAGMFSLLLNSCAGLSGMGFSVIVFCPIRNRHGCISFSVGLSWRSQRKCGGDLVVFYFFNNKFKIVSQ